MNEMKDTFDSSEDQDLFSIKDAFLKYFKYWPSFIGMTLFCLFIGFLYTRYSSVTYLSVAKIKIIDDNKELDIAKDPSTLFWSDSKINMDNEIEILKSYRLLNQVVTALDLDVSYYYVGIFKTAEIWNQPFVITDHVMSEDAINPMTFEVELLNDGFLITDDFDRESKVGYAENGASSLDLPFNIKPLSKMVIEKHKGVVYKVVISPKKDAVMNLANNLTVQPANKKGEILSLSLIGESSDRSEDILNETIKKFNEDGILDRQLISKRTLDFLDERFLYLSGELDSIEIGKQGFKQDNSLSYIEEDANSILLKKSIAADEVFELETQINLSNLLKSAVEKEATYNLIPSDIGVKNSSINEMVSNYNTLALERSKLVSSVGANHPTLQELNSQLESAKNNILKTLNVSRRQLGASLAKLTAQKNLADDMFSRLPEKEKMLRSIDRQQSIKEKLFLLLLQKREEAAVNFAVTAPSIKVVDYGLTAKKPVSPKKPIVYAISLFLGFAIPFLVLFTRFALDNKIHNEGDITSINPEIPVLGEIPNLVDKKHFAEVDDRSVLAESFRILSTNINYQLKANANENGKVIFVSSAIKGEGKTLTALNLSLAYASLKKRVLLIGADLRNPKLDNYFKNDNPIGLSHYLLYPEIDWRESIYNGIGNTQYHKVCYAGKIPNNPSELLAGKGFRNFIENAKKEFEYIIVDTAPTLLVTDTMLISEFADITLFLIRSNFTNKRLLEFSKDLFKKNKLNNMVYVLNAAGGNENSYNYGYEYGYGSSDSFDALNGKPSIYLTLKKSYENILQISTTIIHKVNAVFQKLLTKRN